MAEFEGQTEHRLTGKQLPADESPERTGFVLAQMLWRRRRLLARVTVVGALLSLAIAFLIPKEYEATARLMPPDSKAPAGLMALLSAENPIGGELASSLLGAKSSGELFVQILKSRTVQDRLVDKYRLRSVYSTQFQDKARQKLADNTNISQDVKSGVITISVRDHDPTRAAAMANSYVEELDRLNRDLNTSAAHRERVFLEERLSAVKQQLDLAAKQFSNFASSRGALDIQEQGKAMLGAAAQLEAELISARSELRGLQETYTDDNIRVKAVRARIQELQGQLDKNSTKDSSLSGMIKNLPKLGPQYSDLYRSTKIQEAVYEALTKEYEMAKLQEVKEVPVVKVLDSAIVPERKVFPSRLLLLIVGTMLSFLGGCSFIFLSATWSDLPDSDERKRFAMEIFVATARHIPGGKRFKSFRKEELPDPLLPSTEGR